MVSGSLVETIRRTEDDNTKIYNEVGAFQSLFIFIFFGEHLIERSMEKAHTF